MWWDEKAGKVHRYKNWSDRQQTIDYYWHIGENFKNGVIDTDNLSKSQRLALYAISQQSKFGDNYDDTPSAFWIKERFKHNAWLKMKGVPSDEARKQFIQYAEAIMAWKKCPIKAISDAGKAEVDKISAPY